jgi:outer membrane protein OmpA-like peptidoglycan-associated protein
MKKIAIIFLALVAVFYGNAQNATTQVMKTYDQILPRWCIDVNYKYGWIPSNIFSQLALDGFSTAVPNGQYDKNVSGFGSLNFNSGISQGGDISIGYFLGKKQMFGLGIGASVLQQSGDMTLDSFHVEYQRTDAFGHPYRQIITSTNSTAADSVSSAKPIKENLSITNVSIPILLKFKHQFTKVFGVSADLGALINLYYMNQYTTNAVFDYEAVYKIGNSGNYSYETSSPYGANDWVITRKFISQHDPSNFAAAIADLNKSGLNVGLNQVPKSTSGNVNYSIPSFGAMVQGNLTYKLNYRVTFMLGGYYIYQMFQQSNTGNWMLTNKIGDYNSMLQGVKQTSSVTYGLNIGIRYFLGGFEDMDGDGISDAKDECINKPGLEKFHGCPDTDNDGIPDNEDLCPFDPGPTCTSGCPDRDGDCVADKYDDCPDEAGAANLHGCPDRDGDGIPDKSDLCPDDTGSAAYFGCPVKKAEEVISEKILHKDTVFQQAMKNEVVRDESYLPPHITLKTDIINFDFGVSKMSKESDIKLNECIDALNRNPRVVIYVGGYTDDVGSVPSNLLLSYARAETVREYLIGKGVAKNRIIISGNGKENPINTNKTKEGRAKNRRIEIKLLLPI